MCYYNPLMYSYLDILVPYVYVAKSSQTTQAPLNTVCNNLSQRHGHYLAFHGSNDKDARIWSIQGYCVMCVFSPPVPPLYL